MARYYCDYCDTYLTHDSPSVRDTHCHGRKHKDNVKHFYQKWMEEQAQHLIDATTAAYTAAKIVSRPVVPLPNQGPPGMMPAPGMYPGGLMGLGTMMMGPGTMMMGPCGLPTTMGQPPMMDPMGHMLGPMSPMGFMRPSGPLP